MQLSRSQLLLTVALFLQSSTEGFQTPLGTQTDKISGLSSSVCRPESSTATTSTTCYGSNEENEENLEQPNRMSQMLSKLKKKSAVAFLPFMMIASFVGMPQKAQASAPVMAMPKADVRDPATDAVENHQRKMQEKAQVELQEFNARARQIEASQGPKARAQFEADYKANQEKLAQERLDAIVKLKYDLLDQGICPFVDIEGQRQVIELEKGIDLGAVPGTHFNVEREYENRNPKKSFAIQKAANREVIKCMVQDMKNRDVDPVEYFKSHQDRTASILELPAAQAMTLVTKFKENLDLYGQISPPKEGEISAKERMAKGGSSKEEAKRIKAEAKAKAAAEKAAAKEEKARLKAEAKAAKAAAKEEKLAAKAAAAAAATAAAAASAASTAAESVESLVDAVPQATDSTTTVESVVAPEVDVPASDSEKVSKKAPVGKAAGAVIAVAGGGYAFKVMQDKAAADEAERQQQFKLLMGGLGEDSTSAPALEEVETDLSDLAFGEENGLDSEEIMPVETRAPKKKKKRGLKMFGKKKNSRETDIMVLVSEGAKAPDFAIVLAKVLTFGAPGRFPDILSLPGGMPMPEYDFEVASAMLTGAVVSAGITKEEAAEIFANVVNCMLIDIVDLASSSLKEKDSKVTVDAVGVVVEFMDHAASLFNSIAEGVTIAPVTYGGDLGKGKLEQMYSAYAMSGMSFTSLEADMEDKVALLRDVFHISENKANGLLMKGMQKKMMDMMKSGEGMEEMEEMLKEMGGLDGLGGMPGMGGEEPSPEQIKEMLLSLKELKDSGSIPDSELEEVKKQFTAAFGSSIDDIMKEANDNEAELSEEDKELMGLMKSILDL